MLVSLNEVIAQTEIELSSDNINQYDSLGRKNGFWRCGVSKKLKPTKRTKKIAFYRLVYFKNGKKVLPKLRLFYGFKKMHLEYPKQQMSLENPVLLNGTYEVFMGRKRTLFAIFKFENGVLIERSYFDEEGSSFTSFNWGNHEKEVTSYDITYDSNGIPIWYEKWKGVTSKYWELLEDSNTPFSPD